MSVMNVQEEPDDLPEKKIFNVPEDLPEKRITRKGQWKLNVRQKIGQGGFGSVYGGKLSRAFLGRETVELAVKEQDKEHHDYEVAMLRKLSHPNIVPLLGDYIENDKGFLAVPMYESNLKEWSGECHDILLGVLSGLEYLKTQNIVHCDIKPENICVRLSSRGPEGVIIDFGVAKKNGEEDRGVTKEYIVKYMTWTNKANRFVVESLDHRYDLFCLSVVAGKVAGKAGNVNSSDKELCLELKDLLEKKILEEPFQQITNGTLSLRL